MSQTDRVLGRLLTHPGTRREIAAALGVRRTTVGDVLYRLKRQGFVRCEGVRCGFNEVWYPTRAGERRAWRMRGLLG